MSMPQTIEIRAADRTRLAARRFAAIRAPRAAVRIAPADANAGRIGHFGLFRSLFAPTLWSRVTALFDRLARHGAPA